MKLTLTINGGSLAGQSYALETGHLTVGRGIHCSIRFDPFGEKIASKQHAFIESKPDGFYITDNNSTNGTYVNGQRVQTVKLSTGDRLQFGTNGIEAGISIESEQPSPAAFAGETLPDVSIPGNAVDKMQLDQISQTFQQQQSQTSIVESVSTIGLGNFEVEPEKSQTGKYVGIAITLFAVVFLGLIVTGIMLLSLGPIAAVVAAVVAFIPAIIYLFPIVWLDRYDPEPLWLLSLSFAWGALVAVFLSFIINTVIGTIGMELGGAAAGTILGAVVSAPIFEELTKGAGLLVIVLFFRKYFDGILDGIIFAGVIALGFATVENVLYYGRAILGGGLNGLLIVFFMRGILSPFAHVTFTAMTGIGFGLSRESHNPIIKFGAPIVGLVLAIALHAFWNGAAVLFGGGFFLIYLIIEIPFFLIFVSFAFYIMYRQNMILKEMLAIDVARGLIPEEHFAKATSAFRSTGWLISSIFSGKYRATSRYIRAIGKLGLSYWHIQRATAAQGQTASFQQNPILREEVLKWRDEV
ncbi:MAG: PrsW family intramembrane metalloprotease [Pyrinomonadaceae bacterium]|nr:PrsW family intramembrane metalloprotease [Pyrinomonadaceae bacterium]